jgi:hypothetical protein
METVCRRLNGERISFEEELQRLFDITFVWTPEAQFNEALAVYQEVLPGKGTLAQAAQHLSRETWYGPGVGRTNAGGNS